MKGITFHYIHKAERHAYEWRKVSKKSLQDAKRLKIFSETLPTRVWVEARLCKLERM